MTFVLNHKVRSFGHEGTKMHKGFVILCVLCVRSFGLRGSKNLQEIADLADDSK